MTNVSFLLKVTLLNQTFKGCEKNGSGQQVSKVLIVQQTLLIVTIENVWRTGWRVQIKKILILGFKVKPMNAFGLDTVYIGARKILRKSFYSSSQDKALNKIGQNVKVAK